MTKYNRAGLILPLFQRPPPPLGNSCYQKGKTKLFIWIIALNTVNNIS